MSHRDRVSAVLAVVGLTLLTACTDEPMPVGPRLTPIRPQPLLVSTPRSFTDVDAGQYFTCAVGADGVVECWGFNGSGQALATKSPAVGSFVAVSAGDYHACALRADGVVECWGGYSVGAAPATKAAAVGRFEAVSSGGLHTCALRADGIVECWGDITDDKAPATKAPAAGRFVAVSAGVRSTCAVRSDGLAECWGWNDYDQAPATRSSVGGSFVAVSVGYAHVCALRTDGAVECWGSNDYGQAPAMRTAVSGSFVAVSVGRIHTCALRDDGIAECWGRNNFGEAPATRAASAGRFAAVTAGENSTCALRTDGVAECWGRNYYGEAPATRNATPVVTQLMPTAAFSAPASVVVGQPVPLTLTNAQVPGYAGPVTFSYAFDCGAGFGAASATASQNCSTTAAGTRTVKGKVIDQDGDAAEYTKTVTVLSASQALTELNAAVATATLAPDLRRALKAKLDAALAALAKNKVATACAALADFRSQVQDQRSKAIPTATADAWLLQAAQIQSALGC